MKFLLPLVLLVVATKPLNLVVPASGFATLMGTKNILCPTNEKMIKKRLQDNIENVLNAIDNVVGYHHVAKRQKDLINKGVQGDLNTYIKSLSEVQSAVEFFAQVGFQKLKVLSLAGQ